MSEETKGALRAGSPEALRAALRTMRDLFDRRPSGSVLYRWVGRDTDDDKGLADALDKADAALGKHEGQPPPTEKRAVGCTMGCDDPVESAAGQQPPIDNAHVAHGCEQFDDATLLRNAYPDKQLTGTCIGHLGPPGVADPHPKKATCFNWRPTAQRPPKETK